MPVIDSTPATLKPFTFHGMELEAKAGGQYEGECPDPSCGSLFRVGVETGQWDCKRCKNKGNIPVFLRWLYALSTEYAGRRVLGNDAEQLTEDRGILATTTLQEWGIVKSVTTGDWLVPGYDSRGEIMNLYAYREPRPGDKRRLMSTSGMEHQLFGLQHFDRRKGRAFICESLWDAIVLWEVLQYSKESDKGVNFTRRKDASMAHSCNVLAVPGARVWKDGWTELFHQKQVTILFHSDHPRTNGKGQTFPPEGYAGLRSLLKALVCGQFPPESVSHLYWGEKGYDPELKDGYDLRDWLTSEDE